MIRVEGWGGEGTDLDDESCIICGEAVAEDALDEEAEDLDVHEELEGLREVGARELEELRL